MGAFLPIVLRALAVVATVAVGGCFDDKPASYQGYVEGEFVEAPVYERLHLAVGALIEGPAVLEQPDTTVFVDPGLSAEVDRFGNLVIRRP